MLFPPSCSVTVLVGRGRGGGGGGRGGGRGKGVWLANLKWVNTEDPIRQNEIRRDRQTRRHVPPPLHGRRARHSVHFAAASDLQRAAGYGAGCGC